MTAFDSVEELRIIAQDARLTAVDKAAIVKAADELESAYRTIVLGSQQVAEIQAYQKALEDRLKHLTAQQLWSLSARIEIKGWRP